MFRESYRLHLVLNSYSTYVSPKQATTVTNQDSWPLSSSLEVLDEKFRRGFVGALATAGVSGDQQAPSSASGVGGGASTSLYMRWVRVGVC